MHLGWLQYSGGPAQIKFMPFNYTSPWGAVYSVTDSTKPGPPDVVVRPDEGGAFILYSERGGAIPRIDFTTFHSDSGIRPSYELVPGLFGTQSDPRGVVTSDRTLHVIWHESNTGVDRIRYQRRTPEGFPWPVDDVLIQHGSTLENHSFGKDDQDGLHLTFQRQVDEVFQTCYMRAPSGVGWDMMPTDLTAPEQGDATFPVVMPLHPAT